MRVLAVPNWSFGRQPRLLRSCQELLGASKLDVHFCKSDLDHNRTVTAFSGPAEEVSKTILDLARLILPTIDLNRHTGVHPRIGALDVCPLIAAPGQDLSEVVAHTASALASEWDLPVFLYEKSERGRHEADLPSLRKGGFGGLAGRTLTPDFGPTFGHPHLGATILGHRDFLIAVNLEFKDVDSALARKLASKARALRADGDPRFLGVRALGFYLPHRKVAQLSLNLTLCDSTHLDPIVEWTMQQRVPNVKSALIGVVRPRDLEGATMLTYEKRQVVDFL